MVKFRLPFLLLLLCHLGVAQIECDGFIEGGTIDSAGIRVVAGSVCSLSDVVVQGAVDVFDDATIVATGTTFEKEIKCSKCKKVQIYDASDVGGVFVSEPADGAVLSINKSKFSGTVSVSKGNMDFIQIENSCGLQPGDMDVIIEQVEAGSIGIVQTDGFCSSSGLGDLLVTKNKGDITIGGSSTLIIDSDVTINGNEGEVTVTNLDTAGDIEIASNPAMIFLSGAFGLEDVIVSNNGPVSASVKEFGSLSLIGNDSVDLSCTDNNLNSASITKNSGSVEISNCLFETLECVDNGGSTSLGGGVFCAEDKCDGVTCPVP